MRQTVTPNCIVQHPAFGIGIIREVRPEFCMIRINSDGETYFAQQSSLKIMSKFKIGEYVDVPKLHIYNQPINRVSAIGDRLLFDVGDSPADILEEWIQPHEEPTERIEDLIKLL